MERSNEGPSHYSMEHSLDAADEARQDKRTRRAEALDALRLTGDPVADAHAYFQATETNQAALHEPYRAAFENGDVVGVVTYFKDLSVALSNGPQAPETAQRLAQAKQRFVDEFVRRYAAG